MPTYRTSCECGDEERWYPIKTGVPEQCDTCFAPLIQTLTPPVVRSAEGRRVIEKEADLHKDRDAYKRMRDQGLQPRQIDGCSTVEGHAETQFEVETGYIAKDATSRRKLQEARMRADDYQQAVGQ